MNVKRAFFIIGAIVLLSLAGCQAGNSNGNGGNNGTDTGNPIPTLSSMNPEGVVTGMPAFTLEVTGSSFVDGAWVVFNGTELDTTYVSSTRLTARVSPGVTAMSTAGENGLSTPQAETVTVRVRNPSPGGGDSGSLDFTIHETFAFSAPELLSTAGYDVEDPQISVTADGMVDIVWTEIRGNNTNPVFHRHSSDGGTSWGPVRRVFTGNCSGPTVTRDGDGTLHCIFGHTTFTSILRHATSTDNGATWTTPVNVPNSQVGTTVYPVLLSGEGNTLHLFWRCNQAFRLRSDDAGATWGPRVQISRNPNRPSRLRAEIDNQGNLFVMWIQPEGQDPDDHRVWFSRSLDGGTNWLSQTILRRADNEWLAHASLVAGTGQHLVAAWQWVDNYGMSTERNYVELRYANTLGNTWSTVKIIQPDGDFGMNAALSADSEGNINLFMANGDISYPQGVFQLVYLRSTDNGANWTDAVTIRDLVAPTNAWTESAGDAAGHVYLAFMDNTAGYRRLYFTRSRIPD